MIKRDRSCRTELCSEAVLARLCAPTRTRRVDASQKAQQWPAVKTQFSFNYGTGVVSNIKHVINLRTGRGEEAPVPLRSTNGLAQHASTYNCWHTFLGQNTFQDFFVIENNYFGLHHFEHPPVLRQRVEFTSVPPQACLPDKVRSATCQGQLCGIASAPPIIFGTAILFVRSRSGGTAGTPHDAVHVSLSRPSSQLVSMPRTINECKRDTKKGLLRGGRTERALGSRRVSLGGMLCSSDWSGISGLRVDPSCRNVLITVGVAVMQKFQGCNPQKIKWTSGNMAHRGFPRFSALRKNVLPLRSCATPTQKSRVIISPTCSDKRCDRRHHQKGESKHAP